MILAIAYIIRSGILWIRWVLLALLVIGISGMVIALLLPVSNKPTTLDWCMIVVQNALQCTATIILFVPYHISKAGTDEQSIASVQDDSN